MYVVVEGNNIIIIVWRATSKPPSTPKSPSKPWVRQAIEDELRGFWEFSEGTHHCWPFHQQGHREIAGPHPRDRDRKSWVIQLPKSKININRKMRNKVIPTQNKGEEIILMESGVFPAIYFKKSNPAPIQPPCAIF